jgi:hypothetical protein
MEKLFASKFKMAEKNKKKNDIFQKNSRFFYGETAE